MNSKSIKHICRMRVGLALALLVLACPLLHANPQPEEGRAGGFSAASQAVADSSATDAGGLRRADGARTVRVGFYEYEGYHHTDADGIRSGYGYDFLTLVRRYANVRFEYLGEDKTWDETMQMLRDGEIDIVTSAFMTEDRLKDFDFSLNMGKSSVFLNARYTDTRFIPGNYRSYDGMTVGLIEGSRNNPDMEGFARLKNFRYRKKFYRSFDDLASALARGEVDAVATTSLRRTTGERTLSEFGSEFFYVMARKGEIELLDVFNAAITQMNELEGDWRSRLYQENFGESNFSGLTFTEEEQEYILRHSRGGEKVKVAFDNCWAPFSYRQGSGYVGIMPDYWDLIMKMTGMQYEHFISPEDVVDLHNLENGKADIYLCYSSNPSLSENQGLLETRPILSAGACWLRRKGDQQYRVIGVSAINPQLNTMLIPEDGQRVVEYENNNALLRALKLGDVDEAFLYLSEAEYIVNKDVSGRLYHEMVPYIKVPICAVSSNSRSHVLCSIVSKCMKLVSETELSAMMARNTTYETDEFTLRDYMSMHPLIGLLVILFILAVLSTLFYFVIKHNNEKKYTAVLEESQREKEARLKEISNLNAQLKENMEIMDNAGYGLWRISKEDGCCGKLWLNDTAKRIFGVQDLDLDPEQLYSYYHSRIMDNVAEIEEDDYKSMMSGNVRSRVLAWNHPSKGSIYITAGGASSKESGGTTMISGYIADTTARKKLELRSNLIITTLAQSYLYINYIIMDKGVFLTSGTAEQAKERNLKEALERVLQEDVSPAFRKEMSAFADVDTINARMAHRQMLINQYKDIDGVWHEWSYVVADRHSDGTIRHLLWAVRLIEDEKQAEMRKQQIINDNIAANLAKTRFLQNMSHEIRTPLNALFGFAQLLGMPDGSWTDEEKETYNRYIANSYNMLDMLIGDIIDISDSEHGNYRISISDTNVNAVCRNALMSVEYRKPMDVEMYFTTDLGDDYAIQSDGRRIQQVLVNYLTNACKHTSKGEIHLHCSTTEHPGRLTFSVTDTGEGVPADKADLIFERFTKLNSFVQGSGLGLNICQTVADKLGGEVYLDKSYTGGARFVFVV